MILMDYRREFKRHYADSVDEALKDAILTLYKEGQIPEKLFRIILDDNIDDSVVYTYLLSRREFTKSSMELNSAFNEVREKVNDYLIKINFVRNVCTKNSINTNRIYVIKQYDIPKDLLLSYFGLTPSEIIPLMKRKGFMDKFCVLRLSQAFKEIYSELKVPEHIDHGYSLIYYNKMIQGFSIDYKYMVNINYINDEEHLSDIMEKIKDLDAIVEKKFESKMSYKYFQELDRKMRGVDLASEIDKIVIPVRSGKRSQDIRKPELVIEEAETVNTTSTSANAPILVIDDEEPIDEIVEAKVADEKPSVENKDEKKVDEVAPPSTEKAESKPEVKPEVKPETPVKEKPEQPKPDVKQNPTQKQDQKQPQDPKQQQQNNQKKPNNQKPQQPQQKQQPQKQDNKPKQEPVKKEEAKKEDVKVDDNRQKQPQKPQQPQKDPKQDNNQKPQQQPKQQPKKEERPKDVEPTKEQPKADVKPDIVKPDVVKTEPKPQPVQTKIADLDDDDDDLFTPAPPKQKNDKPSDDQPKKPTLVIDDSDLDMI